MLTRSELPTEYVSEYPCVYKKEYVGVPMFQVNNIQYKLKDRVGSDDMKHILEVFDASGKRLTEINRKIRDLEKNWNGITREYHF
jgi:hypothetical protein